MTSADRTYDVLGTPLLATSYEAFISHVQELARSGGTYAVDFTNVHIVTLRRQDQHFRQVTTCFDRFIPDGMPLIWLLNGRGAQLRDRVYGPTFMRRCLEQTPPPWKHYLLGGSAACLAALQERFHSVNVVGARNGYFSAEEEPAILKEIEALSPDFIWVGLGTPKQQEWIYRYKSQISHGVIFAVGFAFDVNAGTKKDAPVWMQRLGFTWLFRLLSEPRRLFSRYLRSNSLFLYYLAKDAFRRT